MWGTHAWKCSLDNEENIPYGTIALVAVRWNATQIPYHSSTKMKSFARTIFRIDPALHGEISLSPAGIQNFSCVQKRYNTNKRNQHLKRSNEHLKKQSECRFTMCKTASSFEVFIGTLLPCVFHYFKNIFWKYWYYKLVLSALFMGYILCLRLKKARITI